MSDTNRSGTCDGAMAAKSGCWMLKRVYIVLLTSNVCTGFVGSICETHVLLCGIMYRSFSSKQWFVKQEQWIDFVGYYILFLTWSILVLLLLVLLKGFRSRLRFFLADRI